MTEESGVAPTTAPSRFPRSFTIVVFGPLIGAFIMSVILTLMARLWETGEDWTSVLYGMGLYLAFGWVAGLLPAIGSALLWRFAVPRSWSLARRATAAILIGGVCGAILIWPFMTFLFGSYAPNFQFNLVAALCGAIALLATAMPYAERD